MYIGPISVKSKDIQVSDITILEKVHNNMHKS